MFSLAYILRESSDHYPQKMAINIIRFLLACLNQDHTPPSNSKKTTKIVLGTSMKGKNIFHYLVWYQSSSERLFSLHFKTLKKTKMQLIHFDPT